MPTRRTWLSCYADDSKDEIETDSSDEFEGIFIVLASKQI
jgi:hypothetical protein